MFNLKTSQSANRTVKYFTGLSALQVVAVNPTHEELKKITENDNIPIQLATYERRTNQFTDSEEFPVTFWFRNQDGATFPYTINVSKGEVKSANGKMKFINNYGKISSFVNELDDITLNPKMSWYSTTMVKPVLRGEEDIYTLLKQLFRYDEKESGWIEQMLANNLTADKLFSEDKQAWAALREFITVTADNCVVMPLTVKVYTDANGVERMRQEVLFNTELIFRTVTCKVTDYMLDKFIAVDTAYQARTGKTLSKNYYTHSYQEFNKENCIGNAPASVLQQPNTDLDWLS
jgi:hypothetical protein